MIQQTDTTENIYLEDDVPIYLIEDTFTKTSSFKNRRIKKLSDVKKGHTINIYMSANDIKNKFGDIYSFKQYINQKATMIRAEIDKMGDK